MEDRENTAKSWFIAHKRELAVAGICLSTIVVASVVILNREKLATLVVEMSRAKPKATPSTQAVTELLPTPDPVLSVPTLSYGVKGHIRSLPPGRKPSTRKIAETRELDILLPPGCTWVNPYTKGGDAA